MRNVVSLRVSRRSLLIVTMIAVFALLPSTSVFAETKAGQGTTWTVSTTGHTDPVPGSSAVNYGATTYQNGGTDPNAGNQIYILGWNNGAGGSNGWHPIGGVYCNSSGTFCGPIEATAFDQVPGSGSTDRYAAAEHVMGSGGTNYYNYTSTDGNHSTSGCVYNGPSSTGSSSC